MTGICNDLSLKFQKYYSSNLSKIAVMSLCFSDVNFSGFKRVYFEVSNLYK